MGVYKKKALFNEEVRKYHGAYFAGDWCDHAAHITATRKALSVLYDAVKRCPNEDMRGREDIAQSLQHFMHCTGALRFRQGLEIPDREVRFCALRDAYRAMAENAKIPPDLASLDKYRG